MLGDDACSAEFVKTNFGVLVKVASPGDKLRGDSLG
jgi:hypothetical protein